MAVYNEKAKSIDKIKDSVRDLYSVKIKLPCGNPNLKLVHTNQFLFTEFPAGTFELANMAEISKALGGSYSRYSGYELNRWYIESCTVDNDGKKCTMELGVNPFATPLIKYQDNNRGFAKAYTDAFNKNTTNTTSNTNASNKKKIVKSTSTGIKLKNVKGFKKKDQEFIKKVVTQALKKKNNPTNPLSQARAIHEYYKSKHVWVEYNDMPKMCSKGFKGCWEAYQHNCGDGAATLRAMFRCVDIPTDIFLGHGHYWCRLKINGTYYYCDQSGGTMKHNWRKLGKKGNNDNVWHGIGGGSIHNSYC